MTIAAVVLAAGASTRLGEPKQLVRLAGETLLERAVRTAREAGCSPVVVVLGAAAEIVRAGCALGDAVVVVNEGWAEGMGSSVRVGVEALKQISRCDRGGQKQIPSGNDNKEACSGAILMTCDMPSVTAGHLLALMASGGVTASAYAGRVGVPAYFPSAVFGRLQELRGDAGARELLRGVRVVELLGGEMDVDTVEDLAAVGRVFGDSREQTTATTKAKYGGSSPSLRSESE